MKISEKSIWKINNKELTDADIEHLFGGDADEKFEDDPAAINEIETGKVYRQGSSHSFPSHVQSTLRDV